MLIEDGVKLGKGTALFSVVRSPKLCPPSFKTVIIPVDGYFITQWCQLPYYIPRNILIFNVIIDYFCNGCKSNWKMTNNIKYFWEFKIIWILLYFLIYLFGMTNML